MPDDTLFRPVVGIDLGTTNSAIAYIRGGRPALLSIDESALIPSVVHRAPDGEMLVGKVAKDALVAMPERSIASVKRLMGTDTVISLGDQDFSATDISALILGRIKNAVDAEFGEGSKEAVITVPAYFSDRQRRATKDAGEQAGFIVERIVNEPTAAAMAFGLDHLEASARILVYDLGGGTFDVSIVHLESGILEVEASDGDRLLGGDDFDQLIVQHLVDLVKGNGGFDPQQDARAMARLKVEAEQAKVRLSEDLQTSVKIPVLGMDGSRPVGVDTRLSREHFNELIAPLIDRTVMLTKSCIKAAGIKSQDISTVILVGGSTRIPLVRERMEALFGQPPLISVNPDEAVALGAAVQAGIKSGALTADGLIVTDVAPFTMGIDVVQWDNLGRPHSGHYAAVIPKNVTIPTTRTQRFMTVYPGQTTIKVEVYQGESKKVKGNEKLGEIVIDGLPPGPAGREAIDVTFRYSLNGILVVEAVSVSTGGRVADRLHDALDRSSQDRLDETQRTLHERPIEPEDEDEDEDVESVLLEDIAREVHTAKRQLKRLRSRDTNLRPLIDDIIRRLDAAEAAKDLDAVNTMLNGVVDLLLPMDS